MLQRVKEKAINDHLNSDEFKKDLVKVIYPIYLLGFMDAIVMAAKSLSEEDSVQLRMHDNYNPNAKKLASMMAQDLRDQADIQEEKRKHNEWAKVAGVDSDDDYNTEA